MTLSEASADRDARGPGAVPTPLEPPSRGRNPGGLYWLLRNSGHGFARFLVRHWVASAAGGVLLAVALLLGRAYLQPYLLAVRKNTFVVLLAVPLLALAWWLARRWPPKVRIAGVVLLAVGLVMVREHALAAYGYTRLYHRYRTLPVAQLARLPETSHERIQPLHSVHSLAHEVMTETEAPCRPDFVRIGDKYRWSMAIEPAYPVRRIFGGVRELFSIAGTTASPDFSRANRIPVSFDVGENLLFSHSSRVATVRRFGPARLLHYEPASVIYLTDDDGAWVQVVSLIRWTGWLFPRPEFGGVQLIRQAQPGPWRSVRRVLLGAGEWIPPDEVGRHRFLAGQNIQPFEVSRFSASSFRFQNGFWAPFPGYHRGDVRIPDLPIDANDQPFTAFFRLAPSGGEDKLYHFFALEPYDPDKQGLNTSVFVPADGRGPVRVYRHHERSGSVTGVSAIAPKVMESRKNYDWTRNRPVEHRPFIRDMGGRTRFFWLTTVVTFKAEQGGLFIAGSVPDVVLTDATHNTSVWVDPLHPEAWEHELATRLGSLWSTSRSP